MTTIQGLPPIPPPTYAGQSATPQPVAAAPVAKVEASETRQDERQEGAMGRREADEGAQAGLGTRFSAIG